MQILVHPIIHNIICIYWFHDSYFVQREFELNLIPVCIELKVDIYYNTEVKKHFTNNGSLYKIYYKKSTIEMKQKFCLDILCDNIYLKSFHTFLQ